MLVKGATESNRTIGPVAIKGMGDAVDLCTDNAMYSKE